MDDDGEVVSTECDCLYDYGPICKHQAAVLLKLREEFRTSSEIDEGLIPQSSSTSSSNLESLLRTASKESLIAHGDEERAEHLLRDHLHFPDIRRQAIQLAMDNERYDEAIRLAEQGELQDRVKGFSGLVIQWKKARYEAYRLSGETEQQRHLGLELIQSGDFSYYHPVKDAYLLGEWQPIYQNLLDQLEKDILQQSLYTRILVEEQEVERLLAYVKKYPTTIEVFYPYLAGRFRDETIAIFQENIHRKASQSSTRKHYQDVCRVLRLLSTIAGREQIQIIVNGLLAQYPKRPAFREELAKLY